MWHIWADVSQIAQDFERTSYPTYFWWKTHDSKFQSKKKRCRNFYGANAAWLGVFQTESILITNNEKKKRRI